MPLKIHKVFFRRRFLCRLFFFALWVPVVLWLLANVVLTSGTVRGVVAAKLGSRTGLKWSIGSLHWNPWQGVVVSDIVADDPKTGDQVIVVQRAQTKPRYGQLVKRKLGFSLLEVEGVDVSLSPRILKLIAATRAQQAQQSGDGVSQTKPSNSDPSVAPTVPVVPPELAQNNENNVLPTVPKPDGIEVTVENILDGKVDRFIGVRGSLPQGRHEVAEVMQPFILEAGDFPQHAFARLLLEQAMEVKLHDVNLSFRSDAGKELIALEGIAFEHRFDGVADEEGAVINVGTCRVLGKALAGKMELPVTESELGIEFPLQELDFGDVKLEFQGVLAWNKAFFGLGALSAKNYTGEWAGVPVRCESLVASWQGSGFAMRPTTWNVKSLGALGRAEVHVLGRQIVFDQGTFAGGAQQGWAYCSGLSLQGEILSMMANGWLSKETSVSGVVRLVGTRDVADDIERLGGAVETSLCMHPLITPDRLHTDILLGGKLTDPQLQISGRWYRVKDKLERAKQFIEEEEKEQKEIRSMRGH